MNQQTDVVSWYDTMASWNNYSPGTGSDAELLRRMRGACRRTHFRRPGEVNGFQRLFVKLCGLGFVPPCVFDAAVRIMGAWGYPINYHLLYQVHSI